MPILKVSRWQWPAEIISLQGRAAILAQEIQFCDCFHTFGNHGGSPAVGEKDFGENDKHKSGVLCQSFQFLHLCNLVLKV